MPTNTWDLISFQALGSDVSQISLSINNSYRDIIVVARLKGLGSGIPSFRFDNSNSLYKHQEGFGNATPSSGITVSGTGNGTDAQISTTFNWGGVIDNRWATYVVNIMERSMTNHQQSLMWYGGNTYQDNATWQGVNFGHGTYGGNVSPTSFQIINLLGSGFRTGSTISVYGLV